MQFRKFGHTDLIVSEIGFGAWAIGGAAMIGDTAIGWGDADDSTSTKAISAALDVGINFFDTADIYGLGHSEKLLGKLIGKNKEVIIATKVGNVARNNQFTTDYSKEHIVQACEDSLKRLNRDVIDYYQLHSARVPVLEDGECTAALELLRKQGKIRYWGLSLNTFEPEPEATFLINKSSGSGFQLVLNLINQRAIQLMNKASLKGYGMIARMPLQFGLLTGKFDNEFFFTETDHRNKRVTKEIIDAVNKALENVWKLCEKYNNCTKTQLALSYVLSYEEVSVIIPGIRTPEHVKANTGGLFKLDENDRRMIEEVGEERMVEVMELIFKQG